MASKSGLSDRLVMGKLGNIYTKRFLKSKNVNIVSEGDFLSRIRILCSATYLMPFQAVWICFFLYARLTVGLNIGSNAVVPAEQLWLLKEQVFVLNFFLSVQLYHIFLLAIVMIVMLNMTLGKGVTIFTSIFNALYIAEAMLYSSFIFILAWVGILQNFNSFSGFFTVITTQWIWVVMIIGAMISFAPISDLWREVNIWNREWIRIDRYRRTEDKENGFVFKTWVTPGEIKSRRGMIIAGWFSIFIASVFELMDVFANTQFLVFKYIILIFGYVVFIASFVVPYNRLSLIFYWLNQTFLLGLAIYGLVLIQGQAWQSGNWYMYCYIMLLFPWGYSFRAAIRYTWTLKDKEEIKAVVLNMFDNKDDFEKYLEQREEKQEIKESETTI
ncbi:hypothetical protein SCLARK_00834 [Spiroplasma clarkii]|uniref:Transmembrane protein n=1 Tax=Spiroplasma clarkii TaxID=2139 RepID=A0A1Y0L0E5_9MOLU|nr:hypothetical protein [Spiroplasma clarkii]ARU91453.1 hypothetical protein SCLARK_00834 [Spiroplasma clarkii]ATX70874.1 hypothetical protein SCLAR_v1c05550 [Spiroplasma clarkii]